MAWCLGARNTFPKDNNAFFTHYRTTNSCNRFVWIIFRFMNSSLTVTPNFTVYVLKWHTLYLQSVGMPWEHGDTFYTISTASATIRSDRALFSPQFQLPLNNLTTARKWTRFQDKRVISRIYRHSQHYCGWGFKLNKCRLSFYHMSWDKFSWN